MAEVEELPRWYHRSYKPACSKWCKMEKYETYETYMGKGDGDIRRRRRRQDICTVGVMAGILEGGE
jgi:hypothetical protein